MTAKRVLSVGQCMADHGQISHFLRSTFAAEVESAGTADEALQKLRDHTFALILVNRIFDMDGTSGIDFIRRLKGDGGASEAPVLLVSNYPEAQEQAVAAGAQPGFGKAALQAPRTAELLRAYL
jgi:two-component system chemotaxis response regulator CheY